MPVSLVLVVRVEDHREEQRFDSIGSSLPLHRSGEASDLIGSSFESQDLQW